MINDLDSWKLREWLTIYEASCLAFTCDPLTMIDEPTGFKAFHLALTEAIEVDLDTELKNEYAFMNLLQTLNGDKQKLFDDHRECQTRIVFRTIAFKGFDASPMEDFELNDITQAHISVVAIKRWLSMKEFKPAFFFPNEPEQSRTKQKQADNNLLPVWTDLFTSPPQRESVLFSECKDLVIRYIADNGTLPSEMTLWDNLKEKHAENYDKKKQVIYHISQHIQGMSWTAFRKNFKQWTKSLLINGD